MNKAKAIGIVAAGAVIAAVAVVGHGQVDEGADHGTLGAPAVVVMNQPASTTRLEAILQTRGAVIVRGYTDVGTVQSEDGSGVSVSAVELTDTRRAQTEHGLAVGVRQGGRLGVSVLTYVDADELEALSGAMDQLGRLDSTVTQLNAYEGRFKSKGDLEVANFAEGGTRMIAMKGLQILPENGQVIFATAYFPASRLADIKQLVASGRQIIDKARAAGGNR
jgi:hypothetical protein